MTEEENVAVLCLVRKKIKMCIVDAHISVPYSYVSCLLSLVNEREISKFLSL